MRHYFQYHITHICNLRCIHCYQEEYCAHTPINEMMDVLDKYCEYIKEKGLEGQINLTGGEPLLHPYFFEFAKEIVDRGIILGILTNGTLIDDEVAAKISELKPLFVQVSLDGTKKIHDSIRGNGNFDKALNGIECLKKHNIKVLVSFTIQKRNYKSIGALAAICKKYNVDKLWFDRVVTYSDEDTKNIALSTDEFKKFVRHVNILRKYYMHNGKSFISTSRSLQSKTECYHCSAGKNLIIVLADGSVMPCRRLPFIIGNIKNGSFDEIISNSKIMKKLSHLHTPIECLNCKYVDICGGGARCVTYAQTKKLNIKDVNCYRKNRFDLYHLKFFR